MKAVERRAATPSESHSNQFLGSEAFERAPSYPFEDGKADLRLFLNLCQEVQPISNWQIASRPGIEEAAFARPLSKDECASLVQILRGCKAIGLFAGAAEWGECENLEASLSRLLQNKNLPIAYPRPLPAKGEMEFAFCRFDQTVLDKTWKAAPKSATEATPEILFVPGLLMDSLGNRLGRGQGYYDRYFAKNPQAIRIGTIHSRCVIEEFSNRWLESHDQKMDLLWTERGIYRTPFTRVDFNKEFKS